jgi:uncharacterized membrane protein (DUF485 family)
MYKPGEIEKRAEQLVRARRVGERITSSVITLGLLGEEIYRLRENLWDPPAYLYLFLFAVIGSLVFLWQYMTHKEMHIFFLWLNGKYQPPSTDTPMLMIVAIAVILVAMLFAARDPIAFGAVFSAYSVVVPLSNLYLSKQIRRALTDSRVALSEDLQGHDGAALAHLYAEALDVIEEYFLGRWQNTRFLVILLAGLSGLFLALMGRALQSPSSERIAYVVFIAVIVVSEIVIQIRRIRRDEKLDNCLREINEVSAKKHSQY